MRRFAAIDSTQATPRVVRRRSSPSGFAAAQPGQHGRLLPRRATLLVAIGLVLAVAGCSAPALRPGPGAVVLPVPVEAQEDDADCGLACLAALLRHHGLDLDDAARRAFPATARGVRAGDIREYLVARGFRAHLVHGTLDDARPAGLLRALRLGVPVLVQLSLPSGEASHYVLVTGFDPTSRALVLMDPLWGARAVPFDRFDALWAPAERLMLVAAPAPGSNRGGGSCAPAASRPAQR